MTVLLVGYGAFFALLLTGVAFRSEMIVMACLSSAFCCALVFGPVAVALAVYQVVAR